MVVTRSHVLTGRWAELYDEIGQFREACGPAHLKVILATGELAMLKNVGRASLVAMMAGVESIRDVIAFPKTQKASCLLTEAPNEVDDKQLRELGIRLRKPRVE